MNVAYFLPKRFVFRGEPQVHLYVRHGWAGSTPGAIPGASSDRATRLEQSPASGIEFRYMNDIQFITHPDEGQ